MSLIGSDRAWKDRRNRRRTKQGKKDLGMLLGLIAFPFLLFYWILKITFMPIIWIFKRK